MNPFIRFISKISLIIYLSICTTTVYAQVSSSEIDDDGFTTVFNGANLDGWDGDPRYWRVEDGCLIGEVTPETLLKRNTFIIWKGGTPSNFELKLEFKISEKGNSGINYRSVEIDTLPFALRGYQGDIDGANRYTGMNYEERGRTTLAARGQQVILHTQPTPEDANSLRANVKNNAWQSSEVTKVLGDADTLAMHIKNGEWNSFHIIANGNRLLHYVNGVLMSDVTDNDPANRASKGLLGVQVHTGPPMKVAYKKIKIKLLD